LALSKWMADLADSVLHFADSTGSGPEFIERVQNDKRWGFTGLSNSKPL
jgi:hypothetical protein